MQTSPSTGTVELDCLIRSTPSEVFRAWSTMESVLAWAHPGEGWRMSFDYFGFRVGYTDVCRFGPEDGPEYLNESRYVEVLPDSRIVYSSTISQNQTLQFAGTVVVEFALAEDCTQLRLIEQGLYFNPADDVEGHRAGWRHMLDVLKTLLEARHVAKAATVA